MMLVKLWDAYFHNLKFYLFHRISWMVSLERDLILYQMLKFPLEYLSDPVPEFHGDRVYWQDSRMFKALKSLKNSASYEEI